MCPAPLNQQPNDKEPNVAKREKKQPDTVDPPEVVNAGGRMIEVMNVGPVTQAAIAIPPDGGLVVLRGRNGSGKSTTLEAIQTVATGRGKLSVKDGELRGEVRAFGATVTVAQSTRRRGEAEVVTLEGPGDVSTLVDPGLQSPEAADVRRIRALLALIGATCDASSFWPLLSGREAFEKIVRPKSAEGDDPVAMADRIKRDVEAAARDAESNDEAARSRALYIVAQNDGIDTTGESDAAALAAAFTAATQRVAKVTADVVEFKRAIKARDEAAERLATVERPDLVAAGLALDHATRRRSAAQTEFKRCEEMLATARAEWVAADIDFDAATTSHDAAIKIDAAVATLTQAASVALPDPVSEADVELATVEAAERQRDMERGVAIREALRRTAEAETILQGAGDHARRARSLRAAAKGVDDVLSALVGKACDRLRVEAGRLILTTGRGKTYYADLSHGERWKLALDVAIEAVGRGGVLVCPQEAFEGLDPTNRKLIDDHLRGTGVVMFTAEATDDPVVIAEAFGTVRPSPLGEGDGGPLIVRDVL